MKKKQAHGRALFKSYVISQFQLYDILYSLNRRLSVFFRTYLHLISIKYYFMDLQ